MKLLFISENFPVDPEKSVHGIFKRLSIFVDAFREIASLDILFYVPLNMDISATTTQACKDTLSRFLTLEHFELSLCPKKPHRPLGAWGRRISPAISIFQQAGYASTSGVQQVAALEEALSRKPDAIFAHRLSAMCPLMRTNVPLPPIFFDLDDIEHVAFRRHLEQRPHSRGTWLRYLQFLALQRGERRAIRLAHSTFVCSKPDRDYLEKKWHLGNVEVVPNAVSMPSPQPVCTALTLLFIGTFEYFPNANAAEHLITNIWPSILRKVPNARLVIAGAKPENIPSFGTQPEGVLFPGFVDNIDDLYLASRVICCPILVGGGTRIKILEAAAYGKPIVSTKVGAEGLTLQNNEEILLHDDPQDFANACVSLLQNEAECLRLGKAARAAVVERYDRDSIVAAVRARVQSMFKETE